MRAFSDFDFEYTFKLVATFLVDTLLLYGAYNWCLAPKFGWQEISYYEWGFILLTIRSISAPTIGGDKDIVININKDEK